jgi:NhaP-type Na+/H+ or K+/H+ antiporter
VEAHLEISLLIACLLALGLVCQWIAWRLALPAILPLLLAGLALGPGLGWLNPDELLGDLLFPFVSLGVAVILFEGSLTLKISSVRNVGRIIRNLTTIGVVITGLIMAAAAHYLAGLSWVFSFLFGALVSVTGPTVVAPMLRSIQPTVRIANILRWEGILVDPIGAVLAVLVFELIVTGHQSESAIAFGKVVLLGSVFGIAGGWLLAMMLRHRVLPDYLANFAVLAAVLLVFTGSNALGEESGLIAVTVMGMVLANSRDVVIEEILSFKEHLTVLLISVLFILLAARIDFSLVQQLGMSSLAILGVALFIARPISVAISSIGTSINLKEASLLAWVAPRGIVAAAISALFALRLEQAGIEGAGAIVPLTFVIIIGTVVVQSLTAGWLAQRLSLSSRGEQGVLITSTNKVALMLGEALQKNNIRVKIVDTRREGLQKARMLGMEVFYGSALSEHAEHYMDLTGFTHLLAVSRNEEANSVACARYRHYFGPKNVFSIINTSGTEDDEREGLSRSLRSNMLFSDNATWAKLASLVGQGAEIRSTTLSESFNYDAYVAADERKLVELFAVDENGKLMVFTTQTEINPREGWTLISMVAAPEG